MFSGWRYESNRPGKGFLNRLLEENSVPSFWISNDVDQMDPAHLRRFDIVLKFRAPSRAIRRRLVEDHLGPLAVSEDWMSSMVEDEQLLPAEIERASRVARCVARKGSNVERMVERLIDSSRAVTGAKKRSSVRLPLDYELACVNSNAPLVELIQGMKRKRTGRLCLYGPPGTGKTAFAHYLASELDRPLLAKRASEILSMWVGGTERSIAEMFEEATGDGAVLLLDEADSFLQDRSIATRSWEVTQVNELLVQMEAFDGLFICSTNLMDALDTAVLRRFDFKVKLDYLRSQQSWVLFERTMQTFGKDAGDEERFRARLSCLRNLTPGDFAVVKRQAGILDTSSNALTLIEALESESRMKKEGRSQPMGFVTTH